MKIEGANVVRLEPGDVLVFSTYGPIHPGDVVELMDYARRFFPTNEAIFLQNRIALTVRTREEISCTDCGEMMGSRHLPTCDKKGFVMSWHVPVSNKLLGMLPMPDHPADNS